MGMMLRRRGEAQSASPKTEKAVRESVKDEKPKTVKRKSTK
jgi:hypothetical protein